jgi:glucose-1-phosphate cytidylyltransferase
MTTNITKFKKNLTVIILCGGKGQRLRPLTSEVPKPLVKIKNRTILEYIINYLLKFNIRNIVVASGYKNKLIKKFISQKYKNKIDIMNTGVKTKILQRIKKVVDQKNGNFLVCYGDTLVDININKLIKIYLSNKKKIIVSSYQLRSSFGIMGINKKNNSVFSFEEKPNLDVWFNIGYILFSKKFSDLLSNFKKFENFLCYCAKKNLMKSYKHLGRHITINTITELENAKSNIGKFIQ